MSEIVTGIDNLIHYFHSSKNRNLPADSFGRLLEDFSWKKKTFLLSWKFKYINTAA